MVGSKRAKQWSGGERKFRTHTLARARVMVPSSSPTAHGCSKLTLTGAEVCNVTLTEPSGSRAWVSAAVPCHWGSARLYPDKRKISWKLSSPSYVRPSTGPCSPRARPSAVLSNVPRKAPDLTGDESWCICQDTNPKLWDSGHLARYAKVLGSTLTRRAPLVGQGLQLYLWYSARLWERMIHRRREERWV